VERLSDVKVQLSLYMAWRHMREWDYSLQVNDQLHTPVALPAEKHHRYPVNTRLGGPYSQSDTVEENGNENAKLSRCTPMIYAELDVKFHSGRRKL
jgi:hypothetical protein